MPAGGRRESSLSDSESKFSRRRRRDSPDDVDDGHMRDSRKYHRRDIDEDEAVKRRGSGNERSNHHHRRHTRDRSTDDSSRRRRHDRDENHRDHRRRDSPPRSEDRSRHDRRSRSPRTKRSKRSYSVSPSPPRNSTRSRGPLPSQDVSFRGETGPEGTDAPLPAKQKPNFKPTGLLAKEANTVAGTTTVLKYHEPPEARKPPPKEAWRMYVFKGKDLLDTIYLHHRSVWLAGKDSKVTDLLLEHPSISKQHAVIQFRYITSTNEYGDKSSKVKPYLIDLESANGTKLNGKKIEASRFIEIVDGDVLAFGDSEREYVLMLPPAER